MKLRRTLIPLLIAVIAVIAAQPAIAAQQPAAAAAAETEELGAATPEALLQRVQSAQDANDLATMLRCLSPTDRSDFVVTLVVIVQAYPMMAAAQLNAAFRMQEAGEDLPPDLAAQVRDLAEAVVAREAKLPALRELLSRYGLAEVMEYLDIMESIATMDPADPASEDVTALDVEQYPDIEGLVAELSAGDHVQLGLELPLFLSDPKHSREQAHAETIDQILPYLILPLKTLTRQGDDAATATFQHGELHLARVGGRWFLDIETAFDRETPQP
jgi:hypothetical protein